MKIKMEMDMHTTFQMEQAMECGVVTITGPLKITNKGGPGANVKGGGKLVTNNVDFVDCQGVGRTYLMSSWIQTLISFSLDVTQPSSLSLPSLPPSNPHNHHSSMVSGGMLPGHHGVVKAGA